MIRHAFAALLALPMMISAPPALATQDVHAQQPLVAPLGPLARLVGHCWRGSFPDSGAVDVHCYNVEMNGSVISDKHVVDENPVYCGETLYHAVPIPTETQSNRPSIEIRFRYYTVFGGASDGVAIPKGRNTIAFPDEIYQGEDGSTEKFRSVLNFVDDGVYEIRTLKEEGKVWREVRKVVYERMVGGAGEPEGYARCR